MQVQTLLHLPSDHEKGEESWIDHLGSLIQMEIENDGFFLDLGDVSPVDINVERPLNTLPDERHLQQVADAPTSGSLQLVLREQTLPFSALKNVKASVQITGALKLKSQFRHERSN